MAEPGHKHVVQEAFTRQAEAYAASPSITDPARLARLVDAVDPSPEARVLDVATGPGYLAMVFAERCREVIGVDLTAAPLAIAEKNRQQRGLSNLHLQAADADRLPFRDRDFDVVVCRFALHHFQNPGHVLGEMARVGRGGGLVAVEDLITSEHPARAAYQNRFEQLRDDSHTRALSAGELLALFRTAGLEVERLYSDCLAPHLERWLANAQTPPERADEVRALIERDGRLDLSGCRPYLQDGQWFFRQRTLAVVGRKLT